MCNFMQRFGKEEGPCIREESIFKNNKITGCGTSCSGPYTFTPPGEDANQGQGQAKAGPQGSRRSPAASHFIPAALSTPNSAYFCSITNFPFPVLSLGSSAFHVLF